MSNHSLQGLVTQNIDRLSPDAPQFSALLSPQGKILFDFFLYERDGAVLIDCAKAAAEALTKRLSLYRLRADVTIQTVDDLHVATGSGTPPAGAWQDPRFEALGWRALSGKPANVDETYLARRIACAAPECHIDYEPDTFFLMDVNADALNGTDYQKGCFIGQEVASRMKRKGDVRRRTVTIGLANAAISDNAVKAGDSTLGDMLSTNQNQAMAVIRLDRWRSAQEQSVNISAGGTDASIDLPTYLTGDN